MVSCIIPARSNSKRIKNKNILNINNKPIISYAIKTAINSKIFDRVIVSTDSKKIQKISKKYGAECPVLRSKRLSGDKVPIFEVIKNSVKIFNLNKNEFICCLYPTSIFINKNDIIQAYKKLKKTKSDFLCCVSKPNSHPLRSFIRKGERIFFKWPRYSSSRSQDLPSFFNDNGSFSFYKTKMIIKARNNLLPKKSTYFEPKNKLMIDVNTLEDLRIVKILLKNINSRI